MSNDGVSSCSRWVADMYSWMFSQSICWSYCVVKCVQQWVREKGETGGEGLHNKSQNGYTCNDALQDLPGWWTGMWQPLQNRWTTLHPTP